MDAVDTLAALMVALTCEKNKKLNYTSLVLGKHYVNLILR